MTDTDWGMFTAECVRDISKTFPDIGDFHGANAVAFYGYDEMAKLYKTNYKQYKDVYRTNSKITGLALLYGGSYRAVRANSEAEQRRLFSNFFTALKGFSKHLSIAEPKAKRDLYTHNIFGFRVWLKDINHKDFRIASTVRKRFLNAPIQSAGANALLTAMHRIIKFSENTNANQFANDNIHKQYYNRIVTAKEALITNNEFIKAIESLPQGNIALCIENDNNELIQQWDIPLAIDTDFIEKWDLRIFF